MVRSRDDDVDIERLVIDEDTSTIRVTSGFPLSIVMTYGANSEIRVADSRGL
jgi:hypothetical protein